MPDENILKLKEYYNSTFCRTEKIKFFFCKNAKEELLSPGIGDYGSRNERVSS
jgi:hypothetical protein